MEIFEGMRILMPLPVRLCKQHPPFGHFLAVLGHSISKKALTQQLSCRNMTENIINFVTLM